MMNGESRPRAAALGRWLRTVRHLTAEQIFHFGRRRLRHELWRRRPASARAALEARAGSLPSPDAASARLRSIVPHVLGLQETMHGSASAMAAGRFAFLGAAADYGSPEAIDWRPSSLSPSCALWRLTLA